MSGREYGPQRHPPINTICLMTLSASELYFLPAKCVFESSIFYQWLGILRNFCFGILQLLLIENFSLFSFTHPLAPRKVSFSLRSIGIRLFPPIVTTKSSACAYIEHPAYS